MPKTSRFRDVLGLTCVENGLTSVYTPLMIALTADSSFRAAATAQEAMCRAGLRVSEVVRLAPSDIRWKDGMLEVHRGKGAKDRNAPRGPRNGWVAAGVLRHTFHVVPPGTHIPLVERRRFGVGAGLRVLWRLSDPRVTRAYSTH